MSFAALFLGIALFSFAQNNIIFHITSHNGKIFQQKEGIDCMTFSISGLTTDAEAEAFKTNFASNPMVKQFEILPGTNEQGERNARLVLKNKEKEPFVSLLKSVNVTTLNVDKKDYTLDQFDQLGKDLQAKKLLEQDKEQKSKASSTK